MQKDIYERHIHADPDLPLLFFDGLTTQRVTNKYLHWHEDIEILQFIENSGIVFCDGQCIETQAGDVVIIKPNSLHTVCTTADRVSYYCLIVDQSFSNQQKLPLSSLSFQTLVRGDTYIDRIFFELVSEMYEKHDYYKQLVRADVIKLLTHVCRQYQNSSQQPPKRSGNQKDAIVKDIIRYLQHHFTEKISIEQLSHELGFSYSYLCHIFKDVTSLTIVEYIHHLRCNYAMQLLSTMGLSVSEAAERAGFNNVSYFSKIYKRSMGCSPSNEARKISHDT